MKPVMIFFGIFIIISIFGLYNFSVSTIFNLILSIYTFAIVYSLWRKFQENGEEESKPGTAPSTIEQELNNA